MRTNTLKQKLKDGKPVFGAMVTAPWPLAVAVIVYVAPEPLTVVPVAFAPALPIVAKLPQAPSVPGAAWISNPLSLLESLVQVRATDFVVTAPGARFPTDPSTGAVGGRHASTRLPTSSRPPVTVLPLRDDVGVAAPRIAVLI